MAKASPAQLSFSAGEISPLAAARTDADQYKTGLKKCLNYAATAIGPATHRPGTYFAAVAKDSTKKTRVRRFEFSTEQAYVIEFGNLYCRFYKDNAQVALAAQNIAGITNANPAVLTYAGADTYANGDRVTIANAVGMTQVNNREFTVANVNVGANTFELSGVNSTAYGTWTSGGTVAEIYEIVTPYLEADLFTLDLDTQSADVLYITHPSYAPRKLSRTAHTAWTLSTINFLDGPYLDQNLTLDTITPSAAYYQEAANPKNFTLGSVAWSSTQFVAVGAADGTDAYIVTSPDGITWTERANPKNFTLAGVAWSGAQFVAVGGADGTDAYIVTSPDGITWTERANPKNFTLEGVAWSGTQFVAVGGADGTDAYIVTSPDGITWTERANPKNFLLSGVAWSSTQFVAVGAADGTDAYIITSPDGITWTERANPKNFNLLAVLWASTQFIAVGVADGTDAYMVTSPDGITWTERANPKNFLLGAVAWTGTQFVAVGGADGTDAYIIGSERVTLTASNDIFVSTDIGRVVRIKHSGTWGWARIVEYTSPWVVVAVIGSAFAAVTASPDWRLGIWSDTTGYPGASTFFEDRLVFGGALVAPGRIDGSRSGQYEGFAPTATDGTVADSNAISFTINASSVNRVYWLADDENGLLIGTAGGCWAMRASTLNEALTPTNVSAKRFTGFGSKNMQPVRAGQSTVYAQREGRVLRAITYGTSKFAAKDVSIASSHITKTGLVELAYMQYPHETIWAARTDGALLGVLYSKPEESADPEIIGWHRHVLGGAFGSGDAVVESVAVIPSADGTFEQLWLVVKRTINGATVRAIEYMKNFFESDVDAVEDAFFVDCGLTYAGAATTTVGGLWHLEGQTVTILADGSTHPTKTVSNGTVTLDRSATKVHVGLYEDADIETLRFEDGARDGTAQGKTQRMTDIAVRLDNTVGLKYGPTFDDLDELPFRSSGDLTATAVPLFTGDKQLPFHGDYTTEARVCLRQSMPLPSTVIGIYPRLVTQDKG
ncbi:MAG TPA: hypothetical protein VJ396_09335 [Acidiferrobacterales bacterium]|nr:hypothetical protein [Acidiferrobacterales bacterium]